MIRLFLIALLLLSSGPAYAEWVLVSTPEGGEGLVLYVDPDTIRRKGDLVKIWVLADFKTPRTEIKNTMSVKSHYECDCAEERLRMLAYMSFSGNMGSGKPVDSNYDPSDWQPVIPDTGFEVVWRNVRGKK